MAAGVPKEPEASSLRRAAYTVPPAGKEVGNPRTNRWCKKVHGADDLAALTTSGVSFRATCAAAAGQRELQAFPWDEEAALAKIEASKALKEHTVAFQSALRAKSSIPVETKVTAGVQPITAEDIESVAEVFAADEAERDEGDDQRRLSRSLKTWAITRSTVMGVLASSAVSKVGDHAGCVRSVGQLAEDDHLKHLILGRS